MSGGCVPVILSGGAGARLWPISREALPKPFIELPDGDTLLRKTMRRAAALPGVERLVVVTNRDYYFLTRDEYEGLGQGAPPLEFLLEPVGRNTAPAICAAALEIARADGEASVLLILPADHLIRDDAAFQSAVADARSLAAQGWLVTFGVRPTAPEAGFGYIEPGHALSATASSIRRFIEKPSLDMARGLVAGGKHSWNSGMFCASAGALLEAFRSHAPEVLGAVEATLAATDARMSPRVLAEAQFRGAPDISFDYAVMEKAMRRAVVHADFDWSDIGSWSAVAALTPVDAQGNRVNGEVVLLDTARCFIQSERMVAAVGLEDLLIIDSADALLVARADRAQDVKTVVQRLKLASHSSVREHRTIRRPWGSFTVLEAGVRFKIKRIVVKPGASLSLQLHHHRSEHWVVISGTASVVNGEEEQLVRPDESTYIRAGTAHRLSNPGHVECVIIEVQTGDYVGEDDIVRLQDSYGRVPDSS